MRKTEVNLIWSQIVKALMGTLLAVKTEPLAKSLA
jgi:hypothetical protein